MCGGTGGEVRSVCMWQGNEEEEEGEARLSVSA